MYNMLGLNCPNKWLGLWVLLECFHAGNSVEWGLQTTQGGARAVSMAYDRSGNQLVVAGNSVNNELFANFQHYSTSKVTPTDGSDNERARAPPHNVLMFPSGSDSDVDSVIIPEGFVASISNGLENHHQEPSPSLTPDGVVTSTLLLNAANSSYPGSAVVVGYIPKLFQGDEKMAMTRSSRSELTIGEVEEVIMIVSLDTRSQLLHSSEPLIKTLALDNWPVDPTFSLPVDATLVENSDTLYVAVHSSEYVPHIPVKNTDSLLLSRSKLYDLFGPSSSIDGVAGVSKMNIGTGETEWFSPIVSEDDESGAVVLSAVAVSPEYPDNVFVAGSTTGNGINLGAYTTNGGWDGFFTKIDAATGKALESVGGSGSRQPNSLRIQSQPGRRDIVHGICIGGTSAILVGYSEGEVGEIGKSSYSGGAFIIRVNLDDMSIHWTRMIYGQGVEAVACHNFLIGKRHYLWVAGNVGDGVNIDTKDPTQKPFGGQDMFLALIRISNNDLKFIKQFGSSRDDYVVSVTADKNMDAIVFGNSHLTEGPNPRSDMFVMAFGGLDANHTDLVFEGDAALRTTPSRKQTSGGRVFGLYILLPLILLIGIVLTLTRLGLLSRHHASSSQGYTGDNDNLKTPPAESFQVPPLVYRDWSNSGSALASPTPTENSDGTLQDVAVQDGAEPSEQPPTQEYVENSDETKAEQSGIMA